ncbi:hypothetical protein THMIRHAM_14310 [Thiomicrorhabdus immobilis]|uniref:DUF3012 domain-containing protein n=1 Tax=Thiomicrorhabdus immobilis TaxID=2791037 RepID=A0ABN6CX31_9GAMM|nr:hypothetical protein [Thiomicrorhabdus immobilis]BCN93646.1 hypothetical protein THMIRHAM_14310 [Thiomicrorhabdus immobilis]
MQRISGYLSSKTALQFFSGIKLAFMPLMLLMMMSTALTGCEKSAVEKCIDKQSYLWDNKTNDKNANKAYWDAVAKCKQQN